MSKDEKDLELFRAAFEDLDDATLFEGKFGSPEDLISRPDLSQEEDIEIVKEVRDQRLMEDTFGWVEKRDHSKYWVPSEEGEKDLFSALLNEQESKSEEAPQQTQAPAKARSQWDIFAEDSKEAKIIDLRDFGGASAVRELSHSIYAKGVFRVVYASPDRGQSSDEATKTRLENFLKQEKYAFSFSPDSKDKEGLLIFKT